MHPDPVFTTERLAVRRWNANDEAAILALYSDPDVVRWVDDGQPLPPKDAARWIEVTQTNYDTRGYGMFEIAHHHTGETVGFGGLIHPGHQPEPEVKYAFATAVWGQGLATEFVRGLLNYARSAHQLQRVIATVAAPNTASLQVLNKVGFQEVGTRIEEDGSQTVILAVTLPAEHA